jgi:muramoyltetrapeptide carboxypeptidase
VGIISTARSITPEEVSPALKQIEAWGLKPVTGKHLFSKYHQFAGTDEQRLSDLQSFLDDESISAVLCARGGYGTVRIIDKVDFSSFLKTPKWVGGYSDITVLLNRINQLGVEALHCSMPVNFGKNTSSALETLRKALTGKHLAYQFNAHNFNRHGEAFGEVTGGNLSMLYSQTGSPTALDTRNKILFLEDLDEYLYHIDRMMQNLRRNDYLKEASAALIGGMTDMNDNTVPFGFTAEEIIRDHLEDQPYPRAFGFQAGHLDNNNCLIFGRNAMLKIGTGCELIFDEAS